jgi:hypothetical protein
MGSDEWIHQLSLTTTTYNTTFLCNRALYVIEATARRASFVTKILRWRWRQGQSGPQTEKITSYDGRELCQVFVNRCKYTVCIMRQIYLLSCFTYSARKGPLLCILSVSQDRRCNIELNHFLIPIWQIWKIFIWKHQKSNFKLPSRGLTQG